MVKSFFIPGSKSLSARAIVADALAGGKASIHNIAVCDDAERLAAAFAMLDSRPTAEIYIGSGAAPLRFFLAAAASMPGRKASVSCDPQLARRPIKSLIDALRSLGADIDMTGEGKFRVAGRRLKGGAVSVDGSISSQFISALMLAAPCWEQGAEIRIEGETTVSRPYIDMTASVMRDFGARVKADGRKITVAPGGYTPPENYRVEPDWSAASYIYEAVALAAVDGSGGMEAVVPGLTMPALTNQGDAACLELFSKFVKTTFNAEGARLSTLIYKPETCFRADLTDTPDLAPALAATLCGLQVPFRLDGLAHLRVKESDRIKALSSQLSACGFDLHAGDSFLESSAATPLFPKERITVDTFGDHRIAMSMTLLAPLMPAGLTVDRPEVVAKSFPSFWQSFPSLR